VPLPPQPLEIRCPQCGWQQIWRPASDALTVADLPPECCPRCKHADLEARPASGASALWGRLMVIEGVKQFQEKEALIAALKIIALGEQERIQGKGISAAESRAQLLAARQSRK